jgi:transcriptional regulator with XRE-family HTH domain
MIGSFRDKLLAKFQSKKYRDAYVTAEVTTGIAYQIRALREQRHWTQEELGRRLRKGQNAVSRLEDPDYGRLSVKTLTELANAFDVALLVKLVPFTKFFTEIADKTPQGLEAASFSEELLTLERLVGSEMGNWQKEIMIEATISTPQHASIVPFPKRNQNVRMETTNLNDLPNVLNG